MRKNLSEIVKHKYSLTGLAAAVFIFVIVGAALAFSTRWGTHFDSGGELSQWSSFQTNCSGQDHSVSGSSVHMRADHSTRCFGAYYRDNAGAAAGPTPTPWLLATATPWPEATPGSSSGGGGDDDDDDDGGRSNNGDGGSGTDGSAGYPVGGTVVPAILPVTGSEGFSPALLLLVVPLLVFVGWLYRQQVYQAFFETDEEFMAREGILNHDDRSK
jgi:hypothetical protein